MILNRIWPALLLLIPVPVPAAEEEEDLAFLQASVAFDRVMIPALAGDWQGGTSEASTHLERIAEAWDLYQSTQGEVLAKAPGWTLIRTGIDRRLRMVERFIGTDDLSMTRLLLEQVRSDLVRLRQSLDKETFIDLLVEFQDRAAGILDNGGSTGGEKDLVSRSAEVEALREAWSTIENTGINNEVYGLLWQDASELKRLIRAESAALDGLVAAVGEGDRNGAEDHATKAWEAFVEIYLFFADRPAGS